MADQLGGASGNATAADLLTGYTASVASGPISGTMPNQGSPTLMPGDSGPAGYYSGVDVPSIKVATGDVSVTTSTQGTYNMWVSSGTATSTFYNLTIPVPSGTKEILFVAVKQPDTSTGGNGEEYEYGYTVASPFGGVDGNNTSILAVVVPPSTTYSDQMMQYQVIAGSPLQLSTSGIQVPVYADPSTYTPYYTVIYM